MNKCITPVFLGSGRCFHTMDWFRSCCSLSDRPPIFITDNFGREGFLPLLKPTDDVLELFVIDRFLLNKASVIGHLWRNFLKFALIPLQIVLLRRLLRELSNPFVFAHSTYYAFLASFCNVKYSATPQGSEVLVRPFRSSLYKAFLIRSVRNASFVTVDSVAMATVLKKLANISAEIVQNGIDVSKIMSLPANIDRPLTTSIRGFENNYRIVELLKERNSSAVDVGLNFCFPFSETDYHANILKLIGKNDVLHGRLTRDQMYGVLARSSCVISIPRSDSSPRSVYEAIFCGASVICTQASYVDQLPSCMRQRVVLVDVSEPFWFPVALSRAREISSKPFIPSSEAYELFDQLSSMKKCLKLAAIASNVSCNNTGVCNV